MTTIRPVRPTDHDAWADLFRAYREFYDLAPDDERVVATVWAWLTDDAHEVRAFVAEHEGTLVGFAHYRRFARPAAGSVGLYLDDLFAAPQVRGTGVGRALVDQVRALAAAEGCSVVRWITATDNERARHLYDQVATATRWVTYDATPSA